MRYDLMFTVNDGKSWHRAARNCDWKLLLGMVRLWREANPNTPLQAVRHRAS